MDRVWVLDGESDEGLVTSGQNLHILDTKSTGFSLGRHMGYVKENRAQDGTKILFPKNK